MIEETAVYRVAAVRTAGGRETAAMRTALASPQVQARIDTDEVIDGQGEDCGADEPDDGS